MLPKMVKTMSRLKLDDVEWKKFRIRDVFKVENSKPYHKDNLKSSNAGIPYITRTSINNGLEDIIEFDRNFVLNKGNAISLGAENTDFFYHTYDYVTGNKMYRIHHDNINKFIGLFLVQVFKSSIKGAGFGYGKGLTGTRFKDRVILLPVDNNNSPNWLFMEDYAKQEMKSQAEKIVDYYEKKLIDEANILLDLEGVKWNLFQIDEIFDVKRVEGKPINNYENGNIPYVTTSSENNGITNFVNSIESDISKRSAISVDPVGGTTFYHEYDFVGRGFSGSSINLLYNDNLNSLNSKFVCSAIEKVSKVKASYGIHFNGNRLRSAKVLLPSDENGNPNWKYMTDFIKKLEHETASKALEYIYIYKLAIYKELEYSLESREWEVFNLDQVFNLIQRGRRLTRRDQIEGNVPYISSTGLNNGLDNFIGNTDKVRVFNDCLTIANSGSVGATFYQQYEFIGSDHITALKMDKATENIYLFLATKLKNLENKYSFNREINGRRIRREKITLPTKDDMPDYDFMNKYMAIEKIKLIYKILDYYKGLIKS